MPFVLGKTALALAAVAPMLAAAPAAFAADMLTYQERPVAGDYRAVRTSVYVEARPLSCNDLRVEYRAPLYQPRTEILRVCETQSYRYR